MRARLIRALLLLRDVRPLDPDGGWTGAWPRKIAGTHSRQCAPRRRGPSTEMPSAAPPVHCGWRQW